MNGLVFASYKFFLKIQLDNPHSMPTIAQIALAGAGSGIVSSYVNWVFSNYLEINATQSYRIVTTPTELIKIRQQSLLTQTTAREVIFQIFRENGIAGLYRGIVVTALRDCGYGAYFAAVNEIFCSLLILRSFICLSSQYEATCRYLSSSTATSSDPLNLVAQAETRLSWLALLLAGGIAGIGGPSPL